MNNPFFFNSLSELGDSWECDKYYQKVTTMEDKKKVIPKLFITKYDLVRNALNIEGMVVDNISISDFYELVTLERIEECSVSGKLPFVGNNMQICRFCLNERYFIDDNGDVEEKIKSLYQSDKSRFDKFECAERNCKSSAVLNKLRMGDLSSHTTR